MRGGLVSKELQRRKRGSSRRGETTMIRKRFLSKSRVSRGEKKGPYLFLGEATRRGRAPGLESARGGGGAKPRVKISEDAKERIPFSEFILDTGSGG